MNYLDRVPAGTAFEPPTSAPRTDDSASSSLLPTVRATRGGSHSETVALLVRGPSLSPYGDFNLQYEVPAVYEAGEPEIEFTKADKAVLAVTFMAIADPDRTADKNSFGFLRAGR